MQPAQLRPCLPPPALPLPACAGWCAAHPNLSLPCCQLQRPPASHLSPDRTSSPTPGRPSSLLCAAHLHHPPATALSYLDEPDSLLDALLSEDLGDPLGLGGGPRNGHHHGHMAAQQEQQPGSGGTSGASGLVPSLPEQPAALQQQQHGGGGMGGGEHHHHMGGHHHQLLSDAQVVPQPQQHKPLGPTPGMAQYRNGGFGGPVAVAAPTDVLPAVKVDAASFLS